MAIESKLSNFLNRKHWVIPVLFGMMCFFLVGSIVAIEVVNPQNKPNAFYFNIAAELCAMFVGVMITLSIVPTHKRQNGYIRIFVTLIFVLSFTMAMDLLQALVDNNPNLAVLNRIAAVIVFTSEPWIMFFFWIYSSFVLKSKGKTIEVLNIIAMVLLLAFTIIPIVNGFIPFYFKVDAAGNYSRINPNWLFFARSYQVFIAVCIIVAIFLSKESIKSKILIFTFIGLPVISLFTREMKTGTAVQYAAMMVSIVLIFASLFAGNEKELYSTNKELGLATNIQKHMLPSIFPAFPERKEFDIYASMHAAKEVGGDFYDFFLIDETHLGMVIADVSDKGVPAALFMMASKIMVQNYALLGYSPKEVLTRVNKQICSNQQDEMFVSIWFGVLDLKTGILTASNGGHEKPIIKKPNGHFEALEDKHNLVVGFLEEATYGEYQCKIEKGSKIFLYTDGVTEAKNESGQFGMNRLIETLNKYEDLPPMELSNSLLNELETYMGDNGQFDDITMLCLEFFGYEDNVHRIIVKAEENNIPLIIKPIRTLLRELNVVDKVIYKIELALDELLTNVVSYAYPDGPGNIQVEYELLESPRMLSITIIDEGRPFNPLERKDPDITLSSEEREIGGLGIYIVKNTMDKIEYVRKDNKNILSIQKKI